MKLQKRCLWVSTPIILPMLVKIISFLFVLKNYKVYSGMWEMCSEVYGGLRVPEPP